MGARTPGGTPVAPPNSPVLKVRSAITSILDGTERITKTSLEAIQLDHLAETHHHTTRGRQPDHADQAQHP
ncbi:hypothetical protein [Streptomyces orinoci]|uniref:Uncharacterized protein n=1 Tax=Streptomyces orinoci TaxID=67339 RepID=A0ABV3K112_STRON|nr:hypothetical protein [Streptomyces orinoci]